MKHKLNGQPIGIPLCQWHTIIQAAFSLCLALTLSFEIQIQYYGPIAVLYIRRWVIYKKPKFSILLGLDSKKRHSLKSMKQWKSSWLITKFSAFSAKKKTNYDF